MFLVPETPGGGRPAALASLDFARAAAVAAVILFSLAAPAVAATSCTKDIGGAKAKTLVAQCKKATAEGGAAGVCYGDNTCDNIKSQIRDACRAYKFFKRETFEFCGPYIADMPEDAN